MLRFFDGFDHYPSADITLKWTANTSATMSSTTRFSVGQSLSMGSTGQSSKTLTSEGTWILGCAIKLAVPNFGNSNTAGKVFQILSGSTVIGSLNLLTNGALQIVSSDTSSGTTVLATGTLQLAYGVWYYIEWKYVCAAIAGNVVTSFRINGVTDGNFAGGQGGTLTHTTNGTTASVVLISNPNNSAWLFDDFYACDGTGSVNNNFIGEARVDTLSPTGAGNSTQWTPSTGNNWAAVDEATENSDTDYVSTNTATNIDSYAISDLATTPVTIYGLQNVMVARRDDVATHLVDSLVRISTTNYFSSDFTMTSSYAFYTNLMETSPATAVAWTASEINAMEVGVKLVS